MMRMLSSSGGPQQWDLMWDLRSTSVGFHWDISGTVAADQHHPVQNAWLRMEQNSSMQGCIRDMDDRCIWLRITGFKTHFRVARQRPSSFKG